MIRVLQSHSVLFLVCVCLFWLNFTNHSFSGLSLEKFLDGEFPSEAFAISRLVYNMEHGHDAKGGFMLRYDNIHDVQKSTDKEDFKTFKENINHDNVTMYYSHAGMQDDVLKPLWFVLSEIKAQILKHAREGSRWQKRLEHYDIYYFMLVTHAVVALFNALVLGGLVLWIAKTFNTPIAWGSFLFMIVALPILTYFGRSVWWMMGAWFLPLLTMLWWLHFRAVFRWFDAVLAGALAACFVALKVSFGYEYTSTVMMGILVAVIFYAVRDAWSFPKFITMSMIVGVLALFGFAGGVFNHYLSLQNYGLDALEVIQHRFEMRSHGGEEVYNKSLLVKSVNANLLSVVFGYFVSTKELMPPQILIMAPFLVMLWKRRKTMMEDRVFAALSAAIGAGFLGGLSMLVILKGHAYVHGFDIIIWSLPMNIFIGIVYARAISKRFNYVRCLAA